MLCIIISLDTNKEGNLRMRCTGFSPQLSYVNGAKFDLTWSMPS